MKRSDTVVALEAARAFGAFAIEELAATLQWDRQRTKRAVDNLLRAQEDNTVRLLTIRPGGPQGGFGPRVRALYAVAPPGTIKPLPPEPETQKPRRRRRTGPLRPPGWREVWTA